MMSHSTQIPRREFNPSLAPLAGATFDAAFSLFGLMFFPDRKQGFAEIYRTLKPGGSIAITSWAPVDQSPAMQTMFGALRAIKPDLPQPQRAVTTLEDRKSVRVGKECRSRWSPYH